MNHRDYSEDDVRIRPARGKSRPRSKERPEHNLAVPGFVAAVDRGRITVFLDVSRSAVTAVRAREIGRRSVVVGDQVAVVGDTSGAPGTLARIVRVQPRATALTRTPDDVDPVERVVVANADLMGIVTSSTDPAPREGFIDRCLVAAYDAGLEPLIIVTKTDLATAERLRAGYEALGVSMADGGTNSDLTDLLARFTGRITVLIGQSGVGKSTMVNRLVPGTERVTAAVSDATGQGRHTSTSVVALPLPGGGWVIDTPGLRSFGLGHVVRGQVLSAFPELEVGTKDCPRGCTHSPPHCALDGWVLAGGAGPHGAERLASVRRLLRSLS
ncbi:MAG: ribosome small subunit-dependent GTPase A [Candidatus Nanopelagicales bacterium]|nr:ribosome small subunit-dependent GTPase A [Candidatus Nanopelagicales bacterium]MDZ4249099.1 ribosome small subunit-dependent GTPase A [Candidatus Nanopelagicales bacterium]